LKHLWGEAVLIPCSHSTQVAGKKGASSAGKQTEASKEQTSHTLNRLSYLSVMSASTIYFHCYNYANCSPRSSFAATRNL